MVFGNLGDNSGTGVAFTRDAGTGEDLFNGEFLINAQGEDVVAGIRTPQQVPSRVRGAGRSWRWSAKRSGAPSSVARRADARHLPAAPESRNEAGEALSDMQDVEFTIQEGRLWMLQTRNGKRTGFAAMVRIAIEMLTPGLIDEEEALRRVNPEGLNELLHPSFRPGGA